jgi:poly-gamma-glutamate synthesis protein (capsule biosynthesis protein)
MQGKNNIQALPTFSLKGVVRESGFMTVKLSLEEIFSNDYSRVSDIPDSKKVTLIATGDIMPGRLVNFRSLQMDDFTWPYLKVADFLKKGDLTFVNLEAPLVKECTSTQTGMLFCGDQRNIGGLLVSGVNIVNIANNHASNHGSQGVSETVALLTDNNILVTGVKGPVYKEVKGTKFAFLGYNDLGKESGISNTDDEKIKNEISQAKKNADIVAVAFHWGNEYSSRPSDRQVYLGHLAINAGADLIIGNHPHWIQPIEIYKGKAITYSHGNFIFDQMWSKKTREGVVGIYTFYGKKLVDIEYRPIRIENYGQPYLLEGEDKDKILEEMRKLSTDLPKPSP